MTSKWAGLCGRCGRSYYEHRDHNHEALVATNKRCPFGCCGDFRKRA